MRLLVVGSSDAFNASGRGHSCYWLDGASAPSSGPIMVDFGATALSSLKRLGRDPRELDAVLVTHLHGDHIGGIPFLLLDGMYGLLRERPLEFLGPKDVRGRVHAMYREMYGEVSDRAMPFEARWREVLPGEEKDLLGARVRGFKAEHMDPPDIPLCVRVTGCRGEVVAFSGDTAMCEGLLQAAEGADLLVAECTSLHQPAGKHCTWEEWLEVLPRLRAKRVLFTHLGWDVREKIAELKRAAPRGSTVDFAEDGMTIEIER